jgi:hypothetical protein
MVSYAELSIRYHTINSWNRSTSYADCIKLRQVDKPSDVDEETWWHMLDNVELNIIQLM